MSSSEMFAFLESTNQKLSAYLERSAAVAYFKPDAIAQSVWSYVRRPAKRLRPAVLLMACGSVGGDLEKAVPAAAAVEVFHTWTLVHDDLIDNDALRRGLPTVHESAALSAIDRFDLGQAQAKDYGRDIAILTGDAQHGWSITLLADCALSNGVDPYVILALINVLQSYVLGNLVYGETLDVEFSRTQDMSLEKIDEGAILNMLWLKTGILYEFAGLAGAMIGKNTANQDDEHVQALRSFTGKCGLAFQLQDDILGILGDEEAIGKPIGSDIREGKKTIIVCEALKNANEGQRAKIMSLLGNPGASEQDIRSLTTLFQDLGGVARATELARRHLQEARPHLDVLPDSTYTRLLAMWADFMIDRKF